MIAYCVVDLTPVRVECAGVSRERVFWWDKGSPTLCAFASGMLGDRFEADPSLQCMYLELAHSPMGTSLEQTALLGFWFIQGRGNNLISGVVKFDQDE